jgi:hypothetical protein
VSDRRTRDPFGEGRDAARARRLRSLGIALGLIALVALTFAVTMLRLGAHAAP